jgi:hypothetical protein
VDAVFETPDHRRWLYVDEMVSGLSAPGVNNFGCCGRLRKKRRENDICAVGGRNLIDELTGRRF